MILSLVLMKWTQFIWTFVRQLTVSLTMNCRLSFTLLVLLTPCGNGLLATSSIHTVGLSVYLLMVSAQVFTSHFWGTTVQGSILGSFLIYINDLPSVIKFAQAFLFADDTKCYKRIKDIVDVLHLQESRGH